MNYNDIKHAVNRSPLPLGLREQMPVVARCAYFDHAAVGPLSSPAVAALRLYAEQAAELGDVCWPQWHAGVEHLRGLAAELLGASREEISLVANTTTGINLVAEGFPWREGDNVVTLADEFPSNLFPWQNLASRGVETRLVPVIGGKPDLAQLAAACDERTRVVTVSWVGYASGWRHDVAELVDIAHRRGAYLFLDAIQGLGMFPLDVRSTGVDFLAADGHKWLLGPEGAGLFYLRREHLELLRPLGVGWNSAKSPASFTGAAPPEMQLRDTAARYEGGSYNMPGLLALAGSLELLLEFGPAALERQILETGQQLCEELRRAGAEIHSPREPGHCSGILSFEIPGRDPQQVRSQLMDAGVVLSVRGGKLRTSHHAYTTPADIERLTAELAK